MASWAGALIAERRAASSDPLEPIAAALREARDSGTTLVGDISNTMASYGPLANSPLHAVVFREMLGFSPTDQDALVADASAQLAALPSHPRLRATIVPHAPYSVSPALMQSIGRATVGRPFSIHLGESVEEMQFLHDGTGAWRALLESLGVWNASWTAPAAGPVAYLQQLGLITRSLVAVHGVQLADAELETLASAGATLVTCPRSNRWTGAGDPPIDRFYGSGVRVAIGTDSLASVDDLNMFAELAAVRRLAPSVPARALLESATRNGADALGFGSELGTLDPGKRADLIAVRVPGGVRDVEEYLVDGIAAADVEWIPAE
jgi:cytosine/adenosine deaminase-related metal-dependent hydrolase